MKTEYKLASALKTLMMEKPLDSISVLSITRRCHIKRQSFYYYFHDIYDLLTLVYLNEKIPSLEECTNFKEMLELIYKYYERNKSFVNATLQSAGKDLFVEFLYNSCYRTTMRLIDLDKVGVTLENDKKKLIARYYASAYSNSIVYYLYTFKNKTLEGLMNCFAFLDGSELVKSIDNSVKKSQKLDYFKN